jgi:hypothetical protein
VQVVRLLQFGVDLSQKEMEEFLRYDEKTLLKNNSKDNLTAIAKKLNLKKISGNKPELAERIHSSLIHKLQTNNDPVRSIPPPQILPQEEYDAAGSTILFDCQYSCPQRYPIKIIF